MILIAATILALAIAYSVKSKESYHLKPRVSFCSVQVLGNTEQSETMSFTAQLFEDEAPEQWEKKINWMLEAREKRLKFQNERLLEIQAEQEAKRKEAESALKEAGIKLAPRLS